jgi:branched-chain amino acid transport system ATP-binding protein
MSANNPLLATHNLSKLYGGVVAVDKLTLAVPRGSVTGIIGPNGAGKSTLIGLLSGALLPSGGTISFGGRDVTGLATSERARLGIGRTYQIPRPFLDMTVEENLAVAQWACRARVRGASARGRRAELLRECGLSDVATQPATQLPLLRRKRLEVARALALEPQLLLLDEVGSGLIDAEITELIALIRRIGSWGVTIVIVEHVLRIVRECCSQLLVLNFGRQLAAGTPVEILASEEVATVYLGTAHSQGATAQAPNAQGAARLANVAANPDALANAVSAREPLTVLVAHRPVPGAPAVAGAPLLQLTKVSASYGQVRALRDVDLEVHSGEVLALLGANGAGKTTLALVISGSLPAHGRVAIDGIVVSRTRPGGIAALGIAHCMEGRRIFTDLTVEQNLRVAARRAARPEVAARLDAVYTLFPVLAGRRGDPGAAMSGGQQQMLAIGRALMARPRLVIFDEISLGLAPIIIDRLYETLALLKQAGLAMLIVEQDVNRALAIADRACVLEHGALAFTGAARAVREDARLRRLYLGEAD